MKQIREWLESGQDYAQGVALYETHGKSRVVLTTLRYGDTAFTRQKLVAELSKLVVQEKVHVVDTSPKRVLVQPKVDSSVPKEDSSEDVRRQRSTWYAERSRLHAQLELLATDAERRVLGERILVLSELISLSYDEAAPLAEPRPDLAALTDQGEMRRLLANLRPQASKLKKNPARADDLAEVLAAINTLKTKLTLSHA
ncbi:MAG: hypothetical protein ACRYF0_22010 [Janthinobacterium lividum]